jgi:hypothetical protein
MINVTPPTKTILSCWSQKSRTSCDHDRRNRQVQAFLGGAATNSQYLFNSASHWLGKKTPRQMEATLFHVPSPLKSGRRYLGSLLVPEEEREKYLPGGPPSFPLSEGTPVSAYFFFPVRVIAQSQRDRVDSTHEKTPRLNFRVSTFVLELHAPSRLHRESISSIFLCLNARFDGTTRYYCCVTSHRSLWQIQDQSVLSPLSGFETRPGPLNRPRPTFTIAIPFPRFHPQALFCANSLRILSSWSRA